MARRCAHGAAWALVLVTGSARALGASPFPPDIGVSALDGINGFTILGAKKTDQVGRDIANVGDVNGDGVDDLIIGARAYDSHGTAIIGRNYVVFGGVGIGASGPVDLASVDGVNGFAIVGVEIRDWIGDSVCGGGDVNGDGFDDLVIGAPLADPHGIYDAGAVYVVFGGPSIGAAGSVDLSTLDGSNGFVINGIDPSDFAGVSVASGGDTNADGYDDLIIGATGADPGSRADAGEAYVVYGGPQVGAGGSIDLVLLDGTNGFALWGARAGTLTGFSVGGAGDMNGDGFDDAIIGAPLAAPNQPVQAGRGYVLFGGPDGDDDGVIDLMSLNGSNGFVIRSFEAGDRTGGSVASAGDVNGDGYGDVIVGAIFAESGGHPEAGKAYVVFGAPDVGAGGALNLAALSGANGFAILGVDTYDHTGGSVSGAGDIDGDGFDDMVIGAPNSDPDGVFNAGVSYILFGGSGVGGGGSVDLASLGEPVGFVFEGSTAYQVLGFSVSSAGDVNRDGVDDLMIGDPYADPLGRRNAGEVHVLFGRRCAGDANIDQRTDAADFNVLAQHFGQAVTPNTMGDLTGDGVVDGADFNVLAGGFGCGG